MTLVITVIHTY